MNAKIQWSRLLVESGMIVLSILLAFGINTWWGGREARGREEAALAGIARDFEGYRQILRQSIWFYERRVEAAKRLSETVGPEAEADSTTVATLAIVGQAYPIRFHGGTLETLVETDGLNTLRDRELQVDLTRWRQLLDDLEALNEFLMDEAYGLRDYLRPRYPFLELDRYLGQTGVPANRFEPDVRAVLRDLEFSNLVSQQSFASQGTLGYLQRLSGVADSVLMRVDR